MASKVLVNIPAGPFSQLQVKKSHSGELVVDGRLLGAQEQTFRVTHLEQSVRFLQEQHQIMLAGLHKEIESLRERNRDLQFQLIFKEESPPLDPSSITSIESLDKTTMAVQPTAAETADEAARLAREAAAARGEARAAEARALQLQQTLGEQIELIRALDLSKREGCATCGTAAGGGGDGRGAPEESPAELRARLADAEKLVRRLRTDADRQRREVLAGGVTNLLFDDTAARAAHVQCMKNTLTASLHLGGDVIFSGQGYRPHNYHFPPLQRPDYWPEQRPEEFHVMNGRGGMRGGGARRPLTLPELQTNGHQTQQSTVYVNHHTRPRPNGFENQHKNERKRGSNHYHATNETARAKSIEGKNDTSTSQSTHTVAPATAAAPTATAAAPTAIAAAPTAVARPRGKRNHHRKAASTDHT